MTMNHCSPPLPKQKLVAQSVLQVYSSNHHQCAPVLAGEECAIHKNNWLAILKCMLALIKIPEHTVQNMPQWVLKIQPSCVYERSHAKVEVLHCTQNAWNPVIGFLPTTPANCQSNLLCPPSLSIRVTSYPTKVTMVSCKKDTDTSLSLSTRPNIRRARYRAINWGCYHLPLSIWHLWGCSTEVAFHFPSLDRFCAFNIHEHGNPALHTMCNFTSLSECRTV